MSTMDYLLIPAEYYQPELKQGTPLVTKDGNKYGNAVVYKVFDNGERQRYQIQTDFGNRLMFMNAEDVLSCWDISESYKEYCLVAEAFEIEEKVLDSAFCLRERLTRQLELITLAIEELDK